MDSLGSAASLLGLLLKQTNMSNFFLERASAHIAKGALNGFLWEEGGIGTKIGTLEFARENLQY